MSEWKIKPQKTGYFVQKYGEVIFSSHH